MRLLPLAAPAVLLLLSACESDRTITEQRRVLDSFPYVDCGAIAPNDRQVCTVPLFSKQRGKVTIFDIRSVDQAVAEGHPADSPAFIVREQDWKSAECDGGTCAFLEGFDDESDEDTLALPITFAPLAEGEYRAELTVWSNDNESRALEALPDEPDRQEPVWKVQLRGLARPACGRVYPPFIDLGRRQASGAEFTATATIENCGIVTLVVAQFTDAGTGAEEMAVTTPPPVYVLPGLSEEISLSWIVGNLTNGEPTPVTTEVGFVSNATDTLDAQNITVIGNTCDASVLTDWDADADGWFTCAGDCDDADATVSPSDTERSGNGEDDDCDGSADEGANPVGSDDDGDGYAESGGDCDDTDPAISPDAVEVINQIDDDCNGLVDDETEWYDDDRDGFSEREGDCDDANRLVYPGAEETIDAVDNDCDEVVDEGGPSHDDDEDGFIDRGDPVADDCDDNDPWVYVGAFEYCDGYDNDCDGLDDEGPEDEPGGACAFLPEREEAVVEPGARGCVSGSGPAGLGLALLSAAVLGARRRR